MSEQDNKGAPLPDAVPGHLNNQPSEFHGNAAEPIGIVSVNSRGGASSNLAGKVIFVMVVFAVILIGALFGVNKWRAMKHSNDAAESALSKNENKPAQVGVTRKFDTDPPPVPGAQAARQAAAAQSTTCPDGMPGVVMFGPDNKAMLAPNGQPMRVCKDGRVMVPAVEARVGDPPPLPGAKPGQGLQQQQQQQAQQAPPPSRYAGDVLIPSSTAILGTTPSPNAPIAAMNGTLGLVNDILAKQQGGSAGPMPTSAQGGGSPRASPPGSIGSLLTPSQTPMVQAAMLGNRSLLLPKGRTIDCSLSTRVVSDVAGMATCVLTSNVYSDDGRVVLLERGSEAVGEYAAQMGQGQRRLFLLWTRVKTPAGVVINLASPSTDGLGASGIDGFVDNHWWDRIGAAFMLSLVQDAIAYKTAAQTGDGGSQGLSVFQNSSQTGNRMAEKILDSTINIKPTLYKNQGDRVAIFVARDLDFGTVYALRPR